jgi:hypothetical protein
MLWKLPRLVEGGRESPHSNNLLGPCHGGGTMACRIHAGHYLKFCKVHDDVTWVETFVTPPKRMVSQMLPLDPAVVIGCEPKASRAWAWANENCTWMRLKVCSNSMVLLEQRECWKQRENWREKERTRSSMQNDWWAMERSWETMLYNFFPFPHGSVSIPTDVQCVKCVTHGIVAIPSRKS